MELLKIIHTPNTHCQEAIVPIFRLILPVLQCHSPVPFPSVEAVFTGADFTKLLCFFAKKETQLFPTIALNIHTHFPMTSDP